VQIILRRCSGSKILIRDLLSRFDSLRFLFKAPARAVEYISGVAAA